jgi:glycosyltransferase involved in cell wall biosynthesis
MRILWLSNHPERKTGYGRQTALWVPRLQAMGHQVAIHAFTDNVPGTWEEIPVYPGGPDRWGMDLVRGHYEHWKAGLLFTLMDPWVINPCVFAGSGMRVACWAPVDCDPVSVIERALFGATGARPVAMSRHGERLLGAAGLAPLYCPHAVDTGVFRPPDDRGKLRQDAGLAGRFVVGMNAANQDKSRKGFDEAFQAFAIFRERHPKALLMVHTAWQNEEAQHGDGLDLQALAEARGIVDAVTFTSQYEYRAGTITDEAMARFYGLLDVFLNPARAEGFGIPVIEAQACSVPVIVTDASSMPELCGAGWVVEGQRQWNWLHQADWVTPSVPGLVRALEKAHGGAGQLRERARRFAQGYDIGRAAAEHMAPVLAALEAA